MVAAAAPRTLVIACGALARELLAITELNGLGNVTVECLPAALHNRPREIPEAVRARIRRARGIGSPSATGDPLPTATDLAGTDLVDGEIRLGAAGPAAGGPGAESEPFDRILVGYADCGTGGMLDRVCAEEGVERLPGAHCYEFFATADRFARLQDHELGSFYLTDFLVKHFDRLVWHGLGIDDHPELLPMYFGNYTRLVYLAQVDDPALVAQARAAAERLGLTLTVDRTGYGELESTVVEFTRRSTGRPAAERAP